MKILVATPVKHIFKLFERLGSLGEVTYLPDPKSINEMRSACADPDIVFTNPNKLKIYFGKEFFANFPSVKCICTASTGRTHIDLKQAAELHVDVLCIKDELETLQKVTSTADLALTLTLAANRKLLPAIKDVMDGNWDYEKFIGRQLDELTIGVVGLGRLGSIYAQYLTSLGANVLYCDPYVHNPSYERITYLQDLFSKCDIVSLHIHATEKNIKLINKDVLNARKSDFILVNTSRGEVVDESEVLKALISDNNFVYATDVLTEENTGLNVNLLLSEARNIDNLIITPHIGGMTSGAQNLAYHKAVDLLKMYIIEYNK